MKNRRFFGRGMLNIGTAAFLIMIIIVTVVLATNAGKIAEGEFDSSIASLEQVVRKAAVQCYAIEGSYPPDVQYLRDNYGLMINEDKYIVDYEVFASNIMPNIFVFPKF